MILHDPVMKTGIRTNYIKTAQSPVEDRTGYEQGSPHPGLEKAVIRRGASSPVHPSRPPSTWPPHPLAYTKHPQFPGCPVSLDSPLTTFNASPLPSRLLSSRALGCSLDGLPTCPAAAGLPLLQRAPCFLSGCHSTFFHLVAGRPECWPRVCLCLPHAQRHTWQLISPLGTWW